ncbi:response regulator [Sanyastnella coralliicola]|uniref:response regulator n=1 Tax=Sanyastnella coralliicola TaxID=3069118 RepID=UPI0027B93301|nr:response regulator [Longitalea sp. SCSIO 12813]
MTCYPDILIAEDDADDRLILEDALSDLDSSITYQFAKNGEEVISYLQQSQAEDSKTLPRIILLDLNMPKMDGRQTLEVIKQNHAFRNIPILIFTTSENTDDIELTYSLGANSYITKPSHYNELKDIAQQIEKYWLQTVKLPYVERTL